MKKQREKGLVSIIVTNFNNGNYIEKCLDSLINQTYKNIEIIIIDDASTDNSVQVINDWLKSKTNIFNTKEKVFFQKLPRNIGFSGAVTAGLYLSNGEFVAMHDGDDYSHPSRIEKQVNYLRTHDNVKVVGSNYCVFSEQHPEPEHLYNFLRFDIDSIKEAYASGGTAVSYGTMLFYGYIFDEIGGLTRRLDGAEDYEYITKILKYGINNINECLYFYRSHDKQRSREYYSLKSKPSYKKEDLKVLLVIDRFNIGGTETHVLTLAKELLKKGIAVTILAGDGPLKEEFEKLNCKIYNMDFPLEVPQSSKVIESFKNKIQKIIETENINVIHAHQSPSGSLAILTAKKLNIPCIFTIHGMYYDDIVNTMLNLSDCVISVSYPVFDWLINFGVLSRVVPNGIMYDSYGNVSNEVSSDLKRQYNIPQDAITAMYCSRMAWGKIKTCENLIRVCRDLNLLDSINIHALIIGDGPGYKELYITGERVNNTVGKEIIHFAGSQIDMPKYYMASDCIVGTGRVALEAMASKKAVIATGNNGYFGLIDYYNFYDAWKLYFGDHSAKISNNALYLYDDLKSFCKNPSSYRASTEKIYELSKSLFDISVITNKIIDIYLESLNRLNKD